MDIGLYGIRYCVFLDIGSKGKWCFSQANIGLYCNHANKELHIIVNAGLVFVTWLLKKVYVSVTT
jgi:hypothetical protein